jgi:predicted transcriptional regulator
MPSATKATYSLDSETLQKLDRLSDRWQVSKTEALRRALHQAAAREATLSVAEKVALLHKLQKQFAADEIDFERWKRDTKRGRR